MTTVYRSGDLEFEVRSGNHGPAHEAAMGLAIRGQDATTAVSMSPEAWAIIGAAARSPIGRAIVVGTTVTSAER